LETKENGTERRDDTRNWDNNTIDVESVSVLLNNILSNLPQTVRMAGNFFTRIYPSANNKGTYDSLLLYSRLYNQAFDIASQITIS
jgi:hypothetical protein